MAKSRLTVLFEAPFWIGLYEREDAGRYEACKITFGAEPKDYEVYEYLIRHGSELRFSPAMESAQSEEGHISPKRLQREIQKQTQSSGIGTKAQQALKLQQEQGKLERRVLSREQREAEQARQLALRREKHKEKHRGH
mgnify:CR=1 FL=1